MSRFGHLVLDKIVFHGSFNDLLGSFGTTWGSGGIGTHVWKGYEGSKTLHSTCCHVTDAAASLCNWGVLGDNCVFLWAERAGEVVDEELRCVFRRMLQQNDTILLKVAVCLRDVSKCHGGCENTRDVPDQAAIAKFKPTPRHTS